MSINPAGWWFRLQKISHGVYPESLRRVRDDKCLFSCHSERKRGIFSTLIGSFPVARAFALTDDNVGPSISSVTEWASRLTARERKPDANCPSSLELHSGAGSRRIKSARRDVPHSSWRSPNSDLHAGRDPGNSQSANGRKPQGDRRARAPRQHLPPASSSRTRCLQALRRHPSLHELGWPGAHRLRRVSDPFPGAFKSHERRGRPVFKVTSTGNRICSRRNRASPCSRRSAATS